MPRTSTPHKYTQHYSFIHIVLLCDIMISIPAMVHLSKLEFFSSEGYKKDTFSNYYTLLYTDYIHVSVEEIWQDKIWCVDEKVRHDHCNTHQKVNAASNIESITKKPMASAIILRDRWSKRLCYCAKFTTTITICKTSA